MSAWCDRIWACQSPGRDVHGGEAFRVFNPPDHNGHQGPPSAPDESIGALRPLVPVASLDLHAETVKSGQIDTIECLKWAIFRKLFNNNDLRKTSVLVRHSQSKWVTPLLSNITLTVVKSPWRCRKTLNLAGNGASWAYHYSAN